MTSQIVPCHSVKARYATEITRIPRILFSNVLNTIIYKVILHNNTKKMADSNTVNNINYVIIRKSQSVLYVHVPRTWFLKIAFVREVSMCVCPPPRL